jgi:spermidine/putrescine transport system substrate-binding protein
MKKLFLILLSIVALVNINATDRSQILKVYNWADYINQDVLNEFPKWYYEQTGETVEVLYQTFDINESMCTQIEVGHEDYDVICPSEYMIERMLKADLLQKIDKDFGKTPDYTSLISPFVSEHFKTMSQDTNVNVLDYAVGYMWGTTGVLYNTEFVDKEEIQSLGSLADSRFKNKLFIKDAFRDVYSVVVLYVYRDEIEKGEVTRDELVANVTQERIERVEEFLKTLEDNIAGWEVDFGKEEMTKGEVWLNLSWSGDAQWAIEQAEENGVYLDYIIPKEGSNVWFDGWCIPKYAVNTKAASYFINYMCIPRNAILNMEEIGYVSVIASPEIVNWGIDSTITETINLTYFFGDQYDSVYINPIMYPDIKSIEKCAVMHDAGDMNESLINMWTRVKGDNLNIGMIYVVVITILVILIYIIYNLIRKNNIKSKQKVKKHKRSK